MGACRPSGWCGWGSSCSRRSWPIPIFRARRSRPSRRSRIFAGIVLSLGATSVVANLVAGYSLIYRRAFRVGDRVEIAGVIGDVEALSAQATYLRTLKNERVTLPNALVLSSQVTNYSYFARERGLILHTEVGHRLRARRGGEVEALLLEAARRTPGHRWRAGALRAAQAARRLRADLRAQCLHRRREGDGGDLFGAASPTSRTSSPSAGCEMMTPIYVADTGACAKIPPAHGAVSTNADGPPVRRERPRSHQSSSRQASWRSTVSVSKISMTSPSRTSS